MFTWYHKSNNYSLFNGVCRRTLLDVRRLFMEYVIGIILFLIAFIIYGLILRKRVYDQVDRLEAWKMEIMNRNVTEELSKLKTLNLSGETQERFENWRSEWDEIITKQLPDLEEYLFDAEEAADRYRFRSAKKVLGHVREVLEAIEGSINNIFKELDNLLDSEESSRKEIEEIQPFLKELRKQLLQKRYQYGKAEIRFEVELDDIVEQLKSYHTQVDNGNYIEANELVQEMKGKLEVLHEKLLVFPELYKKSKQEIPSQLDDLRAGLKEMKEQGYRINHLNIDKRLLSYEEKLVLFVEKLEKGEIAQVQEGLQEIEQNLQESYQQLEEEAIARNHVQKKFPLVEKRLHEASKSLLQTKQEVKSLEASYQFEEKDLETNMRLEKWLNQLKKQAETLHKAVNEEESPHSEIDAEIESWTEQWEELREKHHAFTDKLYTLRKEEREAKGTIEEIRRDLMEINRKLQKSNLPGIPEYIFTALQKAGDGIEEVALKLDHHPLDMGEIQVGLQQASKGVRTAVEQTDFLLDQARLAEFVIQYANRYRSKYPLLAAKLSEAEHEFRNFNYELSLEQASMALEEIEPGALKRLEDLVKSPTV